MVQRSRAQRLNGLFPLSYTGVVPVSPPNFVMDNRPPTVNDSKNFYIGDIWLDQSASPNFSAANIWMLVSLVGNQATWINMCSCGVPPGEEITIIGDTGGPLVGSAFIFSGGSTGLSFGGSGDTFTLTFAGITANGGTVSLSTDALNGTVNVGTGLGAKTTTLGSTTASSTTEIDAPSAALTARGVSGNIVSNKNYVTLNGVTGQLGSDTGTTAGITITGDTGGPFMSASFTFAGGSTGLSFGGSSDIFTLSFAGITANGGTVSLSTDAVSGILNIGTGAGAKTLTLGSTNTTSTTDLQAGTGGINIPAFTEGALVTDSSGKIHLAAGTPDQVLTANGAGVAPSFQTIGAGSKTLIFSQTVSGVTTLDFTPLPGGYSYYILEALNYWFTVNDNQLLRVWFGNGSGYNTFNYATFQQANESTGSPGAVIRAIGTTGATGELMNGFQGTTGHTQFAPGYGIMHLFGLDSSSVVNQTIFVGADRSNDAVSTEQLLGVGSTDLTSQVTALRISETVLGNAIPFSGTFRLFGVL
jgi:hypothetical protein